MRSCRSRGGQSRSHCGGFGTLESSGNGYEDVVGFLIRGKQFEPLPLKDDLSSSDIMFTRDNQRRLRDCCCFAIKGTEELPHLAMKGCRTCCTADSEGYICPRRLANQLKTVRCAFGWSSLNRKMDLRILYIYRQ